MAKSRFRTQTEGRTARPREFGTLVRAGWILALVLILVSLSRALGATAALDAGLRQGWYRIADWRGQQRPTSEAVVLVVGDEDTVEAWGPPPWPASRLEQLVTHIEKGQPDLMAEVGHPRMFAGEGLSEIVDSRPARALMLHSFVEGGQPDAPWTLEGLERGELDLGPDSRLAALADRSDHLPPIAERLPIHYFSPSSRLPTMSAHQVAAGKFPARTFAGAVVLFGVTDPRYTMGFSTPVGKLSPAQIEAHALAGLADDAVWTELPLLWRVLVGVLLAAFLLGCLVNLRGRRSIQLMLGLGLLTLIVDYQLFVRSWLRLGGGEILLTIVAVATGHGVSEGVQTLRGVRELRDRVVREVTGERVIHEHMGLGYWNELAELGSEYACELIGTRTASTIYERNSGTYQLHVRAHAKIDPEDRAELDGHGALDVRRAPFRAMWLTLRASWTNNLLSTGERSSLIIPLEDQGELLGVWLLHVGDAAGLEDEGVERIEDFGRQMTAALVRRREREALILDSAKPRLRDHVETIVAGMRLLRDEQRWALELFEQLPVRILIATVWGEIEFVDPRLRRELERAYPGLFLGDDRQHNLRAILVGLTGQSPASVQRLMRKVINEGVELELEARPGVEKMVDDVWALSRIRSERAIGLPGFKSAVHEHIVLTARSSAPARREPTRSGGILPVLGGSGGS